MATEYSNSDVGPSAWAWGELQSGKQSYESTPLRAGAGVGIYEDAYLLPGAGPLRASAGGGEPRTNEQNGGAAGT